MEHMRMQGIGALRAAQSITISSRFTTPKELLSVSLRAGTR